MHYARSLSIFTRNSPGDEIVNVDIFYDDIVLVHAEANAYAR